MKPSKHDELVERFLAPMTVDDMKRLVCDAINAVGELETKNEKLREGVVQVHCGNREWAEVCGICDAYAFGCDDVTHTTGCPMRGES